MSSIDDTSKYEMACSRSDGDEEEALVDDEGLVERAAAILRSDHAAASSRRFLVSRLELLPLPVELFMLNNNDSRRYGDNDDGVKRSTPRGEEAESVAIGKRATRLQATDGSTHSLPNSCQPAVNALLFVLLLYNLVRIMQGSLSLSLSRCVCRSVCVSVCVCSDVWYLAL
jgi:hypothetical protein